MHLAGVREGGGGGGLLGSAARRQGRRQQGTAVRYPVGQGRTRGARQPLELVLWTEAADPVAEAAGDEEGRRGRRGPPWAFCNISSPGRRSDS